MAKKTQRATAFIIVIVFIASALTSFAATFGTNYTIYYEDNWASPRLNANRNMTNFKSAMGNMATLTWSHSGSNLQISDFIDNESTYADAVDLIYVITHGGYNSGNLAMWESDLNLRWLTLRNMTLGNSNLEWFTANACHMLKGNTSEDSPW